MIEMVSETESDLSHVREELRGTYEFLQAHFLSIIAQINKTKEPVARRILYDALGGVSEVLDDLDKGEY